VRASETTSYRSGPPRANGRTRGAAPPPSPPFNLKAALARLKALPLLELRARYVAAFDASPAYVRGRSRADLIKRLLFVEQDKHDRRVRDMRAAARDEAARVAREREWHLGVVKGTHCILRCDRCHRERIVPQSTRRELLKLARAGSRPPFECRECREERADRNFRTSRERAGLEETRRTRTRTQREEARMTREEAREVHAAPKRCDRCGLALDPREDGWTVLTRRVSNGTTSEFSRRLCDRCFLAVADALTERLPRSYQASRDDGDPLGGASVIRETT